MKKASYQIYLRSRFRVKPLSDTFFYYLYSKGYYFYFFVAFSRAPKVKYEQVVSNTC